MDVYARRPGWRRGAGGCDRGGLGRSAPAAPASLERGSLGGRATMRVLAVAGTYLGRDLRDPNGLARPLLRRAALRLAVQRSAALRRLGEVYMRVDATAAGQLTTVSGPVALLEAAPGPHGFAAPGQSGSYDASTSH